jgi:hypothetical protein
MQESIYIEHYTAVPLPRDRCKNEFSHVLYSTVAQP